MKTADEGLVPVIAIHEGPDRARVLLPHECEFLAVGLEQAAGSVAEAPTGVWVEMVRNERVTGVEFVFGHFDQGVVHGVVPFSFRG